MDERINANFFESEMRFEVRGSWIPIYFKVVCVENLKVWQNGQLKFSEGFFLIFVVNFIQINYFWNYFGTLVLRKNYYKRGEICQSYFCGEISLKKTSSCCGEICQICGEFKNKLAWVTILSFRKKKFNFLNFIIFAFKIANFQYSSKVSHHFFHVSQQFHKFFEKKTSRSHFYCFYFLNEKFPNVSSADFDPKHSSFNLILQNHRRCCRDGKLKKKAEERESIEQITSRTRFKCPKRPEPDISFTRFIK